MNRRRALLAAVAITPFLVWPLAAAGDDTVELMDFDAAGHPLGRKRYPKLHKSAAEWRAQLSPLAYEVTREEATEMPFTEPGWNNHADGLYRCVCCGTALFDSRTKFDSGTGWPSFWRPIARENLAEHRDTALFEVRTAISCARCEAHLGHVFDDGPRPTGLRYCMNIVALHFIPRA